MDVAQTYISASAAGAAIALTVGVNAWEQRRRSPAAGAIAFVSVTVAIGAALMGAQVLLPSLARIFGLVSLVAISLTMAGFYCEVRALVDPRWRLSRGAVLWLSVHPVAVLTLGGLNPAHLFADGAVVGGVPRLAAPPGPLFWLHVVYAYTLTAWSFQHLLRAMISSTSPLQRRQLRSILLAAGLPVLAALLSLVESRHRQTEVDLTLLSIALAGLVHYYAVFRLGLLRLLPVARDLVVEHVGDAIFVMDTEDRLVDVNPASRSLAARLGWDQPGDLLGVHAWALLPKGVDRQEVTDGEHHLTLADGPLDLDLRVSQVSDRHGHPLGRVIVARDVTQLNDQRRQLTEQLYIIDGLRRDLAEQAVRDDLTGLHNRRHVLQQLDDDVEKARAGAHPFSLIILDIDRFKAINDHHGHAIGDTLLVAISSALLSGIRSSQTLARTGGGEFVVLLPDACLTEAGHIAGALRARCAETRVSGHHGPVSATLSGGIATFPECGWTGSELLKNATAALYAAKRAGRDRVVCAPGA